ncbi:MAG: hypothetical protein HOC74_29320 [Gemmatimonadetes bacterium]|jgi:hypothetical protein|nr:hypothetical protein [Gemmatimonadota bacterium]
MLIRLRRWSSIAGLLMLTALMAGAVDESIDRSGVNQGVDKDGTAGECSRYGLREY